MKMELTKIRAGNLVIDQELKEMRHINLVYVSRYRQNYRHGASMPPLIVDKNTNIVVSGNHRLTAILEEYGEDEPVTVETRKYPSRKRILKDFIQENATHGNPLDNYSKRKLILAFIKEGGTREEAAQILNLPVKKIDDFGNGLIIVTTGKSGEDETKPVKRGFDPPKKKISEKQWKEHDKADSGMPITVHTNQIIRWLRNGFIKSNEKNVNKLTELRDEIDKFLKKYSKKVS